MAVPAFCDRHILFLLLIKAKIEEGPWNKDKAVGQMAPFTPEQAGVIRSLLTAEKKIRDLALFNMALDTMLRASDLLPLRGDRYHRLQRRCRP